MRKVRGRAFIMLIGLAAPAASIAQSPARQPALSAEQAIQLFAEAGFPLRDGRPVNRCGRPANPRIGFIDLNGDGAAEAHIADVDPACYGKPGASFAILAQQPDKSWKRLIAEDGIVGFAAARSSGWNDLSLDPGDSACPGRRRFNGADYGAPTACAALAAVAGSANEAASTTAAGSDAEAQPVTGSRPQRIAQVLGNIVVAGQSRSWDAALAAFPGAAWQPRENHAPLWDGSTLTQIGSIDLGGAVYQARVTGLPDRVKEIHLSSPGDDLVEWSPIAAALREQGTQARNIGCHSPTGFGYVGLARDGHSAILHKSVNYGTMVPSTDEYSFVIDNPFDGRSEAEITADRSWC